MNLKQWVEAEQARILADMGKPLYKPTSEQQMIYDQYNRPLYHFELTNKIADRYHNMLRKIKGYVHFFRRL